MALTIGIIGLPNVGKSTLLNALACAGAEASNYPFCTIDRNLGVVNVPDARLEALAGVLNPHGVIPATVTFVDIAGLVKGAHRGEGLGNKFLHHVREAHALAHVLRCFNDPNVAHVHGTSDPLADFEIVEMELFLADVERVERWMERERTRSKAKKREECRELDFLEAVHARLSRGERYAVSDAPLPMRVLCEELALLTSKPRLIVVNTGLEDPRGTAAACRRIIDRFGEANVFIVSAKIEEELEAFGDAERIEMERELGIDARIRDRFIEKCHEILGLIRYYTTAHEKLQAWSIPGGTSAPAAAGKIHSDMERGFIRAEVVRFEDLVACGSRAEAHRRGFLRTEGHAYEIQDGDVVHYFFNP